MIRNYIKASLRNLLRYKGYTAINIVGLTVGLATSIFIFLWATDEWRFDRFHANGDRTYRVLRNMKYSDGKVETYWSTPVRLAETMEAEVPEVEMTLKINYKNGLVRVGDKAFYEDGRHADATIFKMFDFPILAGDRNNPLPDVNSIAISESLARKYFPGSEAIGQALLFDQHRDMRVTAVFKDTPDNTEFQFDFVIPFAVWRKDNPWSEHWGNNNIQTFVTLRSGASIEAAGAKVKDMVVKVCKECPVDVFFFPFTKTHLYGQFENGESVGGRIDYVISLSLVAVIILVIACINFMNLATARAATRGREVGVRKVIGAQRGGLVLQFIGESVVLSVVALAFSLMLVQILLPSFNELTTKSIYMDFADPVFTGGLVIMTLLTGLIAGSYPAFFLSSFKPAAILKGNTQAALSGAGLRKTLVVTQFVASMVLIVGSIVVYNQLSYIRNKDLGFDKENVVVLPKFDGVHKNQDAFKTELLRHPGIKMVGIAGHNPFNVDASTTDPVWPGKPDGNQTSFNVISCDDDFIPAIRMQILAGRNFTDLNNVDSANYLVNERAMEVMGFTPENIVGTSLDMWNGRGKIIGLVKDFHNENLRSEIEPLVFVHSKENTWSIFVKVEGDIPGAIEHMRLTQLKYDAGFPFEYSFLDESFDKEYRNEHLMSRLSLGFTTVAILISCLGLFGLAAFTAERRVKELGIRKVLGASAISLVALLCSDFARLVALGMLIGSPVAWYLSNEYLRGYAYHYQLTEWVFIMTAAGTLAVALLTVIFQAAKASLANPVDCLKNE